MERDRQVMRVASDTRLLEVDPGSTTAVVVDIVNTGHVIDGVTARVIGLSDEFVTAHPALLPLFPDASGQMTLSLAVPPSHPAGRHPLSVEVVSHGARQPSQFLDLDMDVAARPQMMMAIRPRTVRARRAGRFVVELVNKGNVPLDVTLAAVDQDRSTRTIFAPERLRIESGAVAPVLVNVRGPRMFSGAELDRTVTIEALARHVNPVADPSTEPEVLVARQGTVQLRQRPLISRGLLTALILMGIVALWAAVFLLGLGKVFSGDPTTKSAPASFFAASTAGADGGSGGASGGGSDGSGGSGGASGSPGGAGAAPAGALAKTGQLPAGMGGEITGKVISANDGQPVGRILVEAWRDGRKGPVLVSSAASQADGTYSLAGLFPTSYNIKFSAKGYTAVWYPKSPAQGNSTDVTAVAQGTTRGVNATITGNPASISGRVDPGEVLTPVTTTVTARPLLGTDAGKALAVSTTDASGSYQLKNLPAPGTYQLTFATDGYQANTVVDTVGGGDARLEPTVKLGASTGQISGAVRDGASSLGGATVSTTVGGKALTVITPTTGQVGAFVLGNLPTPATYVITFTAEGHGATTLIVDLGAGRSRAGLDVNLVAGSGSVTGQLLGPDGKGLGGASVTVGGAAVQQGGTGLVGTTTLTAGTVGGFAINGLAVPGSYTLTFTLAGYEPASVPVTLGADSRPPVITVKLANQLGRISGVVKGPNGVVPGATVTATNGQQSWTATSNTADGAYLIAGLQPGTYSVTATASGQRQQTALVTVKAGSTANQPLKLGS
jgi:hypothetical protein